MAEIANTDKTAPTKKTTTKMQMTKETLTKAAGEHKSLAIMAEMFGESVYAVRKALENMGLREKQVPNRINFKEFTKIYDAIKEGANTPAKIIELTGYDENKVMQVIKKMKRDGMIEETLSVVDA